MCEGGAGMSTRTLVLVVGGALMFGAGWAANGWRLFAQHAEEQALRDRQSLTVAQQVMEIGRQANHAISAADTAAWKGLEDDKKELGRLRSCVAAGTCGVRLITKYVPADNGDRASSSSSLGNDTAPLNADVQRRVLDHRAAIGEDAAKIDYLQAYATKCWGATQGSQPSE